MSGLTVVWGWLLMTCPGCGGDIDLESTAADDFLDGGRLTCPHCARIIGHCPAGEACYGLGPDCAVCGGRSGGLVGVVT